MSSFEVWTDCGAAITALAQPEKWPRFRTYLDQIRQLLQVFYFVYSFKLSLQKANSLARDIARIVSKEGRFNAYLASSDRQDYTIGLKMKGIFNPI